MWLCYVLFGNNRFFSCMSCQCHGYFFRQSIFVIDSIFDTFYAIFPFIAVAYETNFEWNIAVGALQTKSSLAFISTFVPMVHLAAKSSLVLFQSRKRLNKETKRNISLIIKQKHTQQQGTSLELSPATLANLTSKSSEKLQNVQFEAQATTEIEFNDGENSSVSSAPKPKRLPVLTQIPSQENASTKDNQIDIMDHQDNKYNGTISPLIVDNDTYTTSMSSKMWKVFVCLIGVTLLGLGTTTIGWFTNRLENSDDLCTNPSDKILALHPELAVWDQCTFQTLPFWSTNGDNNEHDYNCNCRKAIIDVSIVPDGNVTTIIESLLMNWYMLETLKITDEVVHHSINLSDFSHYSAKRLSIIHIENIAVTQLSEGIENWKDLEYMYFNWARFSHWPVSMKKLDKISYLHLGSTSVQEFPPNLCSLGMSFLFARVCFFVGNYNTVHLFFVVFVFQLLISDKLRAIFISTGVVENRFGTIPNCVSDLPYLESFIMQLANVSAMPAALFNHPNLKELVLFITFISSRSLVSSDVEYGGYDGFIHRNFSQYGFDEMGIMNYVDNQTDYYNWQFKWNKDAIYMIQYSTLCNSYLRSRERSTYPYSIIDFINQTGACELHCDDVQSALGCSPISWQNGICDSACNTDECDYDGGDCNQLCNQTQCDIYTNFNNGNCDTGCNNTYCSFDKGECAIVNIDYNQTYCNSDDDDDSWVVSFNNSDDTTDDDSDGDDDSDYFGVINTTLCPTEWLADGWCDSNCYNAGSECGYDFWDCDCESSASSAQCNNVFGIFELFVGEVPYMQEAYLCESWDTYVYFVGTSEDVQADEAWQYLLSLNCSQAFSLVNTNGDEYGTIDEYLTYFHTFNGLTYEKAQQVDCMLCLGFEL